MTEEKGRQGNTRIVEGNRHSRLTRPIGDPPGLAILPDRPCQIYVTGIPLPMWLGLPALSASCGHMAAAGSTLFLSLYNLTAETGRPARGHLSPLFRGHCPLRSDSGGLLLESVLGGRKFKKILQETCVSADRSAFSGWSTCHPHRYNGLLTVMEAF